MSPRRRAPLPGSGRAETLENITDFHFLYFCILFQICHNVDVLPKLVVHQQKNLNQNQNPSAESKHSNDGVWSMWGPVRRLLHRSGEAQGVGHGHPLPLRIPHLPAHAGGGRTASGPARRAQPQLSRRAQPALVPHHRGHRHHGHPPLQDWAQQVHQVGLE